MPRNLIIFAKEPVAGRVKTRLARHIGAPAATCVYEAMVAELSRTLQGFSDGALHWWVDGDIETVAALAAKGASFQVPPTYSQQPQGDLGKRLKRGFADTFTRHSGPVAAIGTDCPTLDADMLNRLFMAVESGADAAVIPASDGGYAALALAARHDRAFEDIRWSSRHTLSDTVERFNEASLKVEVLPSVSDVDEYGDLQALCRHIRHAPADKFLLLRAALSDLGLLDDNAIPDDLCRPVPLGPAPARIVSLVPSVTECLFDLGMGGAVVGRTDYCISPAEEVEKLPSVGGPKSLEVARIVALRPDLVWADAEENSREEVEALIDAGLRVFVALPRTLGDVASFLRRAALLCASSDAHKRAEVEALRLEELSNTPPKNGETATPTIALIWREPYMSVTPATLPGALMEAAGFANLVTEGQRPYPELSPEEISALAPKVLLLPNEPYLFTDEDARELERLFPTATAVVFPGEWLCWYGIRTFEQVEKLKNLENYWRDTSFLV